MLDECLLTDKKLCPFPNLRIHYWDLRQRFTSSKPILNEDKVYIDWREIDTPEKFTKNVPKANSPKSNG
jgi:hypothetical protein